jgi:hypothetical protein
VSSLKHKPRANIKQLQINLASKFASANAYSPNVTTPSINSIPSVADNTPTAKRKQPNVNTEEEAYTQQQNTDESEHESFNDGSEYDSSDEDDAVGHLGLNFNSQQGL